MNIVAEHPESINDQRTRQSRVAGWIFFLAGFLFLAPPAAAQNIQVGGYVKMESIYDTRQVLQVREGHLHLFPLPRGGASETDNLLFNAFQSRLQVAGSGTSALGADVSGVIEGDFFGVSNDNANGLRLRHAYVRLDWGRHELLAGQYWSPLLNTVYPQVINASAGAPFQPFARLPQVRYTWKPGAFRLITALSQQRDSFSDIGGSKQQQQSGMPAAHLHGEMIAPTGSAFGAGAYLKALRPEPSEDRFTAWAAQTYGLVNMPYLAVRTQLNYGNDLTDHLMTGGFVRTVEGNFEPLKVLSGWVDLTTRPEPLSFGLFAGYLTNLGAACKVAVASDAATRAHNMEQLWRVAPRAVYTAGRLRLTLETEVTSALYADRCDEQFRPRANNQESSVVNVRALLAAFYMF